MKTFNKELKTQWINTMQAHQDADRLIQGLWLSNDIDEELMYSGCFFGCAMQGIKYPLAAATKAMQLPINFIAFAENIFENLSPTEAVKFPVEFLNAIPTNLEINNSIIDEVDYMRISTRKKMDKISAECRAAQFDLNNQQTEINYLESEHYLESEQRVYSNACDTLLTYFKSLTNKEL